MPSRIPRENAEEVQARTEAVVSLPGERQVELLEFTEEGVTFYRAAEEIAAALRGGVMPGTIALPEEEEEEEEEETAPSCAYCDRVAPLRRAQVGEDDEDLCERCISWLSTCVNCGDRLRSRNVTTLGGNDYCPSCADSYTNCPDCSEVYHVDEEHCCVQDRSSLADHNARLNDFLYDVTPLGKRIVRTTYSMESEPDTRLYIGMELEIEAFDDGMSNAVGLCGETVTSLCKEDGSLSEQGFEWVTAPFTPNAWRAHRAPVETLCARLREMGCRSYNTDTCGLHLHLSRAAFAGQVHVFKFCSLVYHNPAFTFKLSQRASRSAMEQWAGFNDCSISNLPDKVKKQGTSDYRRYAAVNLNNRHTVELRFFRGTLNPKSLYRALQFAEAALEYSRGATLETAAHLPNFHAYVHAHAKLFPELAAWLRGTSPTTSSED